MFLEKKKGSKIKYFLLRILSIIRSTKHLVIRAIRSHPDTYIWQQSPAHPYSQTFTVQLCWHSTTVTRPEMRSRYHQTKGKRKQQKKKTHHLRHIKVLTFLQVSMKKVFFTLSQQMYKSSDMCLKPPDICIFASGVSRLPIVLLLMLYLIISVLGKVNSSISKPN